MKKMVQKGFTLIQRMLMLAVIGILATMAIPAYRDYTLRGKMQTAVDLAEPARVALSVACLAGNLSRMDNVSLGLATTTADPERYVRNITARGFSATEAVITITLTAIDEIVKDGQQIRYTGVCNGNDMSWTAVDDLPAEVSKYLPKL